MNYQRMPSPFPYPRPGDGIGAGAGAGAGSNSQLLVHLSRYIKGNYAVQDSSAEAAAAAVAAAVAPQYVVPSQPVNHAPIAAHNTVHLGSEAELRMAIDWLQRSASDMEGREQQKAALLNQLRSVSKDTHKQA